MKKIILLILTLGMMLSMASCRKGIKVVIPSEEDITEALDFSVFHGFEPDISGGEFIARYGIPDEYDEDPKHNGGDWGEPVKNMKYFFPDGKIYIYWDGIKTSEIGVMYYTPKYDYFIEDFCKDKSLLYQIEDGSKSIKFYHRNVLYFQVNLDGNKVEKIGYWNVKKSYSVFNVYN